MKPLKWLTNHPFISLITFILLVWTAEKLWPLVFYKFFNHPESSHVETVVLKSQPGILRFEAVGTIRAAQDIVVASEVMGTIQGLSVTNGQTVKQGEPLLNIRHDDIKANLQRDQAVLTQKMRYYDRLHHLLKNNAVSQETLSEAYSAYQQAEASVKADEALLDKYSIKAPFSGLIGIWQIDVGQLVKPGDPLVSLTQLSPAYVDFMLPAKALGNVKVGDDIQFTTASYADQVWHGNVVAIDPQLDNVTRSMKIRAQIENHDNKLVPRLYGQVVVMKKLIPQLSIPQEAIIYDPKGASVYVLQKNIVNLRPVTLGTHQDNDVVIEKGLKPGEEVVTAGMMKLFPGVPVVVNKRIIQPGTLIKQTA